jgi:hypothetical protein
VDYIYLNFNSCLSSLFTLFALLVVNNWNQIVKMYVKVSDFKLVEIYFGLYFIFAVLISYYILVATIIEYVFSIEDNVR